MECFAENHVACGGNFNNSIILKTKKLTREKKPPTDLTTSILRLLWKIRSKCIQHEHHSDRWLRSHCQNMGKVGIRCTLRLDPGTRGSRRIHKFLVLQKGRWDFADCRQPRRDNHLDGEEGEKVPRTQHKESQGVATVKSNQEPRDRRDNHQFHCFTPPWLEIARSLAKQWAENARLDDRSDIAAIQEL